MGGNTEYEGDRDRSSLAITLQPEIRFLCVGGVEGCLALLGCFCLWLLCALENLAFTSGRGTWIKCGSSEPCEARSGALQGTASVTSLRTAACYVSI